LRSPADVVLLNGPPWWSWKRFAVVSGALLLLVLGTLGWTHLLHRRLERQHAAQLMFSRQILQGQETERRRIAANLHDSLGQNLLVIKNQARLAMQPGANESILRSHASEISEMASQAIEEVRQITYNLRPHQLDRLGLTHAVRAALNRVSENSSISFASDVDGIDGLLDAEAEIHFYRIVQESLNNIIKHSGATEVALVVKKHKNSISLSVRDNGRGFDANASNGLDSNRPGFGLKGIEERTRILRGKLTVESKPRMGASLTVDIPFSPPRT
jgi:signal transduction histidine kinase